MADSSLAPPEGLEQFLAEPASPLNPAPVAAPKVEQTTLSAEPPPPGLSQFVMESTPTPGFLDRHFGYQQTVLDPMFRTPEEKQRELDFGGIGQQAITALEGAASALTFGVSTGIEVGTGMSTPKRIQTRREENPDSNLGGQALGLFAGLFNGTSELRALGTAARAIESVGAAAGSFSTNRIVSAGLKAAAENMMVQGGDEVSKYFSQDPNQHLQTAAVNIGLSGLIGGGIGAGAEAVLGKISPLWAARKGNETTALVKDVVNEASNAEAAIGTADNVILDQSNKEAPKDFFGLLSTGTERPNADLVRQAAIDNGLNLGPEAFLVESQRGRDSLSKRPTVFGAIEGKDLRKIYEVASDLSEKSLAEASTLSKYEAGGKIIDEILDPLKKEGEALQARFKAQEPTLKLIEADPELKAKAVQSLVNNEFVKVAPEIESLANKTAKQIQGIDNLVTLKRIRTYVNNEIEKALPQFGGTKDLNKAGILLAAKDALTQLEEGSIAKASAATGIGRKRANEVTTQMVEELQALRKDFAKYKTNLRETGMNLGVGDMYSAKSAEAKLFKPGLKDEAFVNKVLDPDNVGVMKFMQEKHPEAFETARRYKLKEIKNSSISLEQGGDMGFRVGSFLTRVNKMSPEAREALFRGNAKMVRDAELLYTGALPKNFNPSGTAAEIAWGKIASPSGLIDNASDALKYALLKGVPVVKEALGGGASNRAVKIGLTQVIKSGAPIEASSFKALVDYIEHAIKGDAEIAKMAASVFEAGSLKLPNVIVDEKSREKLNKRLLELQENPEPLANVGGDTANYAPDHGTAIAQTTSNAVNYLNSLRPSTSKKLPFDSAKKPDAVAQANFNRALDIAQQPLIALDGIKHGRVSSQDMKTLQMVYPSLRSKIVDTLNKNMVDTLSKDQTIPYKTRIGVSIFTGQPLDSSLTAETIRAAQPKLGGPAPQGQQQLGGGGGHRGSMKALDKMAGQFQTPLQARENARGNRR